MDGEALLEYLATLPPEARDAAVEARLGLGELPDPAPPGEHLVGYHPSGVASIVRAVVEAPIRASDVVVDLGAGLGKVALLVKMLAGATVRGVEIQPALVARAREIATRLDVEVTYEIGDVRDADLDDATVFFAYDPFTGPALDGVLARLHAIATRREILVVTLGLDLARRAPWLVERPVDAFWLSIYESRVAGAEARVSGDARQPSRAAAAVAFEERPPYDVSEP